MYRDEMHQELCNDFKSFTTVTTVSKCKGTTSADWLCENVLRGLVYLTLKALNKNCSRRHFNFLLLSFKENKT